VKLFHRSHLGMGLFNARERERRLLVTQS